MARPDLLHDADHDRSAPLTIVISGPGGVGKGTIVKRLIAADDRLRLSRSWTTRDRRPGEPADAYHFVDEQQFQANIDRGGFLEYTEFLGNMYGTPLPDPSRSADGDLVLEIELDGARQVLDRIERAVMIFIEPPSLEEQQARLRGRGDSEAHVERRVQKAESEMITGREIADRCVVNDDLDETVETIRSIINCYRNR